MYVLKVPKSGQTIQVGLLYSQEPFKKIEKSEMKSMRRIQHKGDEVGHMPLNAGSL